MDTLSVLAAGGMRARIDALDLLANNIANTSTPGFKADREFYDTYISQDAGEADTSVPDVRRRWTDLSQGTLTATGNPLDLAISGKGFFSVQKADGGVLLTRDGSFRVSVTGDLETAEGYKVSNDEGKPIRLNAAQIVSIAPDGTVTQSGRAIARLGVVDVANAPALEKQGAGYFRLSDVAGITKRASGAEVQQGKLEMANCSPAEAAVRLVSVMRQFETMQKAVSIGAEMNRKAVEDVARVGG